MFFFFRFSTSTHHQPLPLPLSFKQIIIKGFVGLLDPLGHWMN